MKHFGYTILVPLFLDWWGPLQWRKGVGGNQEPPHDHGKDVKSDLFLIFRNQDNNSSPMRTSTTKGRNENLFSYDRKRRSFFLFLGVSIFFKSQPLGSFLHILELTHPDLPIFSTSILYWFYVGKKMVWGGGVTNFDNPFIHLMTISDSKMGEKGGWGKGSRWWF